jgi:hypothetical protein
MTHPLASTLIKFNRGELHLGELRALLADQRDTIRVDADLRTDAPHYRLALAESPEVPSGISAILGDCIHNFRACLDHLMTGLARLDGSAAPKVYFPVLTQNRWVGRDRVEARKALKAISAEHQGIIKAAQPYQGWNGPGRHPILELHELDKIDKHRDFNAAVVMPVGAKFRIVEQRDCDVVEILPLSLGKRLEPHAVIGQIRVSVTGPNPKVSMEAIFHPTVEFEHGGEIVSTMEGIAEYLFAAVLSPLMPGATREIVIEEDGPA